METIGFNRKLYAGRLFPREYGLLFSLGNTCFVTLSTGKSYGKALEKGWGALKSALKQGYDEPKKDLKGREALEQAFIKG